MKVVANDVMRLLGGRRKVTGQLRPPAVQIFARNRVKRIGPAARQLNILTGGCVVRKVERYAAARLRLRLAEVDGTGVDTRRGAGFKAAHLQAQGAQRVGDTQGRAFSRATAGLRLVTYHKATIDEGTGG